MDNEQVSDVQRDRDDLELAAALVGSDEQQFPVIQDRRDPGSLHRETGTCPADAVLA